MDNAVIMLGFQETVTGLLCDRLFILSKETKCIESLSFHIYVLLSKVSSSAFLINFGVKILKIL